MADTVVFGRVAHTKRAMVHALQSRGRTVAMTGDGVNDVLALKDSDAGIAMGSGSSATRAVAQLVLLDNRFATLPVALAQGRRVINNIERVANLFLTKTAYAVMLALLVGVFGTQFPFLPRQQTLLDAFSIGVPGFVLALAPAPYPIRPGLLRRVLSFAIPAGAIIGIVAFIVFVLADRGGATLAEARTATTFTMLGIALVVLVLGRPLVAWKLALAAAMLGLYVATAAIEPLPSARDPVTVTLRWQIAAAIVVGGARHRHPSVADAVERRGYAPEAPTSPAERQRIGRGATTPWATKSRPAGRHLTRHAWAFSVVGHGTRHSSAVPGYGDHRRHRPAGRADRSADVRPQPHRPARSQRFR